MMGRRWWPLLCGGAMAGGYVLLAGGYVAVSSTFAGSTAQSVEELARIELMKGLGFIGVTAALLFVLTFELTRRLRRDAEALVQEREALLASERRAMAGALGLATVHDFNNMLQIAQGNAQLLERDLAMQDERVSRAHRSLIDA